MRKENVEFVEEPVTHWEVNIETPWNLGEQVIGEVPMGLIAKAYHRGDADPTEVVGDALARLKADEEDEMGIHPMVYIFQESAMAEAAASSQRYQDGKPLGPLDGVPMVIKDVMNTAGVPTCSGTGFVGDIQGSAESDGAVVAKLRAAGAVILGKSISHEFILYFAHESKWWGVWALLQLAASSEKLSFETNGFRVGLSRTSTEISSETD